MKRKKLIAHDRYVRRNELAERPAHSVPDVYHVCVGLPDTWLYRHGRGSAVPTVRHRYGMVGGKPPRRDIT